MPSKKGHGGAKGKGPAPKGKGKQATKKPVPLPSSSSEDELDVDQLAVLGQLAAIERAQGVSSRSGAGRRDPIRPWTVVGEVLDRLASLHSQTAPRSLPISSGIMQPQSQFPQPALQQTVIQESGGVTGTSVPESGEQSTGILGSADKSGGPVVSPVVSGGVVATSGSTGETQMSWPWGALGNPAAFAMMSVPTGRVGSTLWGLGVPRLRRPCCLMGWQILQHCRCLLWGPLCHPYVPLPRHPRLRQVQGCSARH